MHTTEKSVTAMRIQWFAQENLQMTGVHPKKWSREDRFMQVISIELDYDYAAWLMSGSDRCGCVHRASMTD
ncbi:hypothetical protein [Absidia glauca]|uniref:Uncharacterized protein n=1 Tax=Absidia glauca TaxID=4829 RepID=A0A168P3A6_ABSGL|nr:hypothetical protein [Absidia glauca]